jgi:hypothetical protein
MVHGLETVADVGGSFDMPAFRQHRRHDFDSLQKHAPAKHDSIGEWPTKPRRRTLETILWRADGC